MKRVSRIGLALSLSAILIGCTSAENGTSEAVEGLELGQQKLIGDKLDKSQDVRAFCPKTVIRAGTESYRTYADGVSRDDPDAKSSLRFQATVTEVARECNYVGDTLNIKVGIRGRVINGPTGASGTLNTPIRVALVSTANEVFYSELYQVPVSLPEGASTAKFSYIDNNISIPDPDKRNLVIYVGFDEGPKEGASDNSG
jgi:hypothetical protein